MSQVIYLVRDAESEHKSVLDVVSVVLEQFRKGTKENRVRVFHIAQVAPFSQQLAINDLKLGGTWRWKIQSNYLVKLFKPPVLSSIFSLIRCTYHRKVHI